MSPQLVLAFDPGGTTGYALVEVSDGLLTVLDIGEFKEWSQLDRLIVPREDLVVVYEHFSALDVNVVTVSLEVIGVIKYLCHLHSLPMIRQVPSQRLNVVKRHPYVMGNYSRHHGDAFMHALTYVEKVHGLRNRKIIYKNVLHS